jgi:ribonuclease HI/exonuclease III
LPVNIANDRANAVNPRINPPQKNTRAAIKIASLNMRGRGGDKWLHINQIMKEKKIGILALQETHLTDQQTDSLHNLFGKRLKIINSIEEDSPNSKGVAIVINKEITNSQNITTKVLVPGRALFITTQWHQDQKLSLLAIYAPNNPTDNEEFWVEIKSAWRRKSLPKPDIMLGDFNVVEDSVDRIPCHPDNPNTVDSLNRLRTSWHLIDGWRHTFPNTKAYTFLQKATGTQSRIDRIYLSNELTSNSYEWAIDPAGIETDHSLISTKVSSPRAPFIGKGRWSLPTYLLENRKLLEKINKLGLELEQDLENNKEHRNDNKNPQTMFQDFKATIIREARRLSKEMVPKMNIKIEKVKKKLEAVLNDETMDEMEKTLSSAHFQEELDHLEKTRHTNTRLHTDARNRLEGETISKYWTQICKEKTPRDTIKALKILGSDPPRYEFRSQNLAELAKAHHDNLQQQNDPTEDPNHEQKTSLITRCITKIASDNEQKSLAASIMKEEVLNSLKQSPNNKAAGLDGIPIELWKALNKQFISHTNPTRTKTDITNILTTVYNDIVAFGISPNSNFAEGWLCPIYKKGDVRDIANYRPITVLNTDYKILTKLLANRLAPVASSLINENQAGFLPGRSISDQVRTAKLLIEYAERSETNGAIVALDQEKAYDKIAHNYLWLTLQKFKIPDKFINIIKSIYQNARTTVILNGVLSSYFKITRGVRQGDPLSCLLFDLAIEPLALTLYNSNLKGIKIPGLNTNLKATLFADDTTVYLAKTDRFTNLQQLLGGWCEVSGAKFNITKTEIIPIGSPEHRQEVTLSRKLDNTQERIPQNIHIARDGEPTRLLGAWIGNRLNQPQIWSKTLDNIESSLTRWGKSHPTLEGRRLIIQMTVAGMTQYLTKVQGMPKEVENKLTKSIREFMWNSENTPPVNSNLLTQTHNEGGKKVLNITARNEAINLMWLRSYLLDTQERPKWAYIADELLRQNILKSDQNIEDQYRINTFTQSWNVNVNKLPTDLKEMVKVARKYKVQMEALHPSIQVVKSLPIWSHASANDLLRLNTNIKEAKCMRKNHKIMTVGQTQDLANKRGNSHKPQRSCQCNGCRETRQASKCHNPHKCQEMAIQLLSSITPKWNPDREHNNDNLDLTPQRKGRNEAAEKNNEAITFDPNISITRPQEIFRVFSEQHLISRNLATRPRPTPQSGLITVYTDGSCKDNGYENARAGSGIWYGYDNPRNKALRLPGSEQSNQRGELYAILQVIKETPAQSPLLIKTDSKYVIKGLTRNLNKWEDTGWIGIANKDLFKVTAAWLRQRSSPTRFQWVKGHSGEAGNEEADKLANQGADLPAIQAIDLTTPENFTLTGAKLHEMSQAKLYKGILEHSPTKARPNTTNQLNAIRLAISNTGQSRVPNERIWASLRKKTFTRNIRDFMWKSIHKAHKVGSYWENIPEHESRAKCSHCHTTDSMEHILTECHEPEQETIWSLAKTLWKIKYLDWPQITVGIIMGCGTITFKNNRGKPDVGKNRLFQILISESAHLIWKLRCERVIKHEDNPDFHHTRQEVCNRWIKMMNKRICIDYLLTDKRRYKRKATKRSHVVNTWAGLLTQGKNLPEDNSWQSRVLVGITPLRPPGRNR